ncbi:DUF6095 family protein [Mesonia sp. MT50]|uniref:DUF6095 family protein n=1 Tax=Mesonia profundi TaxID=3070998 RepID=A0ABU0ZY68_9FLAO|nr:DUF6095 family protein [Mesonia profundi]MDQ7916396.1 DUF6095 family protein [Mesonia profundi]
MKRTNKEVLFKGVRYLAGALPLMFIGPSVIYSAFNNREHPLYVAVLILGILACGGAMFLIYKGINTIMKAMFDS